MPQTQPTPRPRRALPPLMSLTDAAAARLSALYAGGKAGMLLRVGVAAKGCSGLSYDMSWVEAPGPGDEVVTERGVSVVVDRKATLFLVGSVMDYATEGLSSGFTFVNPNEKARCGCGESFMV